MDPQPEFTFQDLFSHVIGDMAKAVAERSGEAPEQQFVRTRAAAHMILGFLPRDVPEAMLAGHCVMLHEIMTANVRTTFLGDAEPVRRGPDASVAGLNKAFNETLDRLLRYQKRPPEGSRDTSEAQPGSASGNACPEPQGQTDPPQPGPDAPGPNRAARRQAARAEIRSAAGRSRAAPQSGVVSPKHAVSMSSPAPAHAALPPEAAGSAPAAAAACEVNVEAVSALKSGDPAGLARAMGVAQPSEAFLAPATTKGSPFEFHASGQWPNAANGPSATP